MNMGMLYLIPAPLSEADLGWQLPARVLLLLSTLDGFIVENARTSRRFLGAVGLGRPMSSVPMQELNEHTPAGALPELLAPLEAGQRWGLLSEAGCPAVADPGADLVALAQERGVRVVPLVGPSSILLALMGSGLGGQNFAFHGYLPVAAEERQVALLRLEELSRVDQSTQIFIETPYRNNALLASILGVCRPQTRLCLATDMTSEQEWLQTRTVAGWRGAVPDINKRPTVFLLLSGAQRRR